MPQWLAGKFHPIALHWTPQWKISPQNGVSAPGVSMKNHIRKKNTMDVSLALRILDPPDRMVNEPVWQKGVF